MNYYAKDMYNEYRAVNSNFTMVGLFRYSNLKVKISLILIFLSYALFVVFLTIKSFIPTIISFFVFLISFIYSLIKIRKQTGIKQVGENIKILSDKLLSKGYDDNFIKTIIDSNKELDKEEKEWKDRKFDKFFKLFTTIYLSLFIFISKEVWDLYIKSIKKDSDKYVQFMAIIVILLILVGFILLGYVIETFFTTPKLSKIKYFNNSLEEVLVYRKLKKKENKELKKQEIMFIFEQIDSILKINAPS